MGGLHRWAFLSPSFQLGLASGSQQETREKKESSQGIYSPGSLPLQPLWAGYLPQPKATALLKVASSTQGSGFQYLLPHLHLSDPWVFTAFCPALPLAASLYSALTLWTVPSSDPSWIILIQVCPLFPTWTPTLWTLSSDFSLWPHSTWCSVLQRESAFYTCEGLATVLNTW